MKRLSLVVLVVSLLIMTNSAFAADYTFQNVTSNWTDSTAWTPGIPDINCAEAKVKAGNDSHCTVTSNVHVIPTPSEGWTAGNRLRVYEDANMVIADNAYIAPGWMRAGAGDIGKVTQTGGEVDCTSGRDNGRIVIGDDDGSDGLYIMSGGTMTYDTVTNATGMLILGDRGGKGTFVVEGTGPTINMKTLRVGGRELGRGADATLEFKLGSGVSSINVETTIVDPDWDEEWDVELVITSDSPITEFTGAIVLVKNSSNTEYVDGVFDSIDTTDTNLGPYIYVTKWYNADSGSIGNDIALVPEPATVALFGLGLIAAVRRRPRRK